MNPSVPVVSLRPAPWQAAGPQPEAGAPGSIPRSAGRARTLMANSLLAGLCLVVACSSPPEETAGATATSEGGVRHIVVISVDTLRADHLGCYGYERDTSPFIDELAAGGVLFEQAISSAPWTLPSHASLLSGVYPSTHRAVDGREGIAPSVTLAAERFGAAGWATGGFVSSWFVSHRYGFDRGFDRFDDFEQTLNSNTKHKVDGARVIDEAVRWLRQHAAEPFFLFVHLYDVHFNYDPPSPHRELFDTGYDGPLPAYRKYSYYLDHPLPADVLAAEIGLYDGAIHYADAQIQRLHAVLAELGRADDTLIVLTADHGEEFFERGSWGHAHTLYEEQVHVPLILRGPGLSPRRVSTQVRHVDVLPTLLDLAGLPVAPGLHGVSLRGLTGGPAPGGTGRAPRPAFLETSRFGSNVIGLRRDGAKVIYDLKAGTLRLFDLVHDPGEQTDRAVTDVARLDAMEDELLTAAAALLPDRWLMRFYARGDAVLHGAVTTSGRFLRARTDTGDGSATLSDDGSKLRFALPPGAVLEMAVMPVDATVSLAEAPTAAGEPVPVTVGKEASPLTTWPVTASSHEAALLTGVPVPDAPALALWLTQSRSGGGTVNLTEEDIRRLESLGYVMR
ncbi:MAG: sulfatase [Acidobacteriota bacterium]